MKEQIFIKGTGIVIVRVAELKENRKNEKQQKNSGYEAQG